MRWIVLAAATLAGCSHDMSLPPQRPLTITPSASSIAPRQTLAFEASGGASGYRFGFSGSPGSGVDATLDPATGAYRAGSSGPGTDVVEVVDQGGTRAAATVTIGAPLTISPQIALTAPGGRVTFAAEGGLPPYAFRFQPKGNRSTGRIDGVTGEYAAGPNTGAIDKVEVVDAAGAVARPLFPVYVGSLHFPLPGGASELELADLNGDFRKDVLALEPQGNGTRRLTTAMLLPGGAIAGETYFMPGNASIGAADLTGDGRADVFVGAYPSTVVYLPDPAGHLVAGDTLGQAMSPRLPWFVGYSGYTGCAPYASGIYTLAWNSTAASFDPPTCVTSISQPNLSHLGDLLTGDFDGSGSTDVAWLERDSYAGPIYLYGTPQLHYATATPRILGMPAGSWSAYLPTGGQRNQVVAGNFRGVAVA
jgi:hypothetical protein